MSPGAGSAVPAAAAATDRAAGARACGQRGDCLWPARRRPRRYAESERRPRRLRSGSAPATSLEGHSGRREPCRGAGDGGAVSPGGSMTAAGLGLWAAITVAVAGPATSPEYLPLHVAQAEGYFAAEKLEVTLRVEPSERDAAEALARGRVTIAATSLDAAYRLGHVKGSPPPLIFGLTAAAPVAVLLSPNHKDTIHSPAELRGQLVGLPGVGTPEQAML